MKIAILRVLTKPQNRPYQKPTLRHTWKIFIDSLGNPQIFAVLDALWGYWKIPIIEKETEKTTFTSHPGTNCYSRILFGICNTLATVQCAWDSILCRVQWKTMIASIDFVVIFSINEGQYVKNIDEVLTPLRQTGVALKLTKCLLLQEKIKYFGHILMFGSLSSLRRTLIPSKQLIFRQPEYIRDYFWVYVMGTEKSTKIFLNLLDPLNTGFEITRNWILGPYGWVSGSL